MSNAGALLSPISNSEGREIGGVRIDVVKAGASRVKTHDLSAGLSMVGTYEGNCGYRMVHARARWLSGSGQIHIEYEDGCIQEFAAPAVLAVEPRHDGWVIGDEPAVVIEFDFDRETTSRLGMPNVHSHNS